MEMKPNFDWNWGGSCMLSPICITCWVPSKDCATINGMQLSGSQVLAASSDNMSWQAASMSLNIMLPADAFVTREKIVSSITTFVAIDEGLGHSIPWFCESLINLSRSSHHRYSLQVSIRKLMSTILKNLRNSESSICSRDNFQQSEGDRIHCGIAGSHYHNLHATLPKNEYSLVVSFITFCATISNFSVVQYGHNHIRNGSSPFQEDREPMTEKRKWVRSRQLREAPSVYFASATYSVVTAIRLMKIFQTSNVDPKSYVIDRLRSRCRCVVPLSIPKSSFGSRYRRRKCHNFFTNK